MSTAKYKDPSTGEWKKLSLPVRDNTFVQPDEPIGAGPNAIWVDTDEELQMTAEEVGAYSKTETDGLLAQKAPAGFGLGETPKKLTASDDLNNFGESGWYWYQSDNVPQNAIVLSSVNIVRVDGYYDSVFVQTVYGCTNAASYQTAPSATRRRYGTVITPWEYVNPPMLVGGYDAETDTHTNEYRTTERYLGKPVYAKLLNCGTLPNATSKVVRFGGSECRPVGLMYGYSTSNYRSYHLGTNPDGTVIGFSHYNISIQTTADLSTTGVFIAVKYIKTTD